MSAIKLARPHEVAGQRGASVTTNDNLSPEIRAALDQFEKRLETVVSLHLGKINVAFNCGVAPSPVGDVLLVLSATQRVLAKHVLTIGGRPDIMSATTFVLMGMQQHVEQAVIAIRDQTIVTATAEKPAAGPN